MAIETTKKNGLEGYYFHSVNANGEIEWQGVVVEEVKPDWFLVRLFNWITGEDDVLELVCFWSMTRWLFYEKSEDMRYSYEYGPAAEKIRQTEGKK